MKKKIVSFAVTLSLALLTVVPMYAASGSAKVYYNTNLSVGTTSSIQSNLSNMGYSATRAGDPSMSTVRSSFGNSNIVHILSHGAPGVIALKNGNLTANQIKNNYSSLSTKFVFLEGCQMANSSPADGNLDNTLYSLGVKSTLAFSENVTAGTDSNGVHLFANLMYQDMRGGGYDVVSAAAIAMSTLYNQSGQYYGVNSMVIKGNVNIN